MRRIRALLPPEGDARVAGIVVRGRRRGILDGAKALVTGPRFEQRAIHREVVRGEELLLVRQRPHLLEERLGDVPREQPIPVLGEHRRIPDGIVRREAHKPAVQEIVVELLHELPLAPDGVEHLEQQGAQQLLRRNRGTADGRVQPPEAGRQRHEQRIDQPAHGAQRMIGGNAIFDRPVAEQDGLPLVGTTHRSAHREG